MEVSKKEEHRLHMQKWRKENPEKNKKTYLKSSRKYRSENRIKCNKVTEEWRKKNKEYYDDYNKAYRKENKEKIKKYQKKYYELNEEKIKFQRYAYQKLRKKIINERKKCEKCGSKKHLDIHHKKYTNNGEDLKLLCRSCHMKEHEKTRHS